MNDLSPIKAKAAAGKAMPLAMIYVRDRESEAILRRCLSDLAVDSAIVTDGGIANAISDLAHRASPRLLIVDISGVADPAARIHELAQVCDPSTGVIAIGDVNDVVLYRNLKNAGIVEYFFKPLVFHLVRQSCTTILTGNAEQHDPRIGKLIVVMGVRGGVGTTGIATWMAWRLAELGHRRVLLIDLDLNNGDAALQLDVEPNHTLCEALEQPDRVDDLLLERGMIHVTPRLDLLASLEPLDKVTAWNEDAVLTLISNLRNRYRYVFIDLPAEAASHLPRLLLQAGACFLVSDSSLVAARDVARWRDKIGPNTAEHTTVHIVNKAGANGRLPMTEFVRALGGRAPDLVIPYEREIGETALAGVKGLAREGALSRALAPMFKHLTGETVQETRSFFDRLFH